MTVKRTFESQPFNEAIEFFQGKLNIPTQRWNDLWQGMHARGFMVAGAAKADLLTDLRGAVDKAISKGATLDEFRLSFDDIVARHGWTYNGGRDWRTRIIYETNMNTAHMAGRYRQMTDPDVTRARPYWQYRHMDSANPRLQHVAWDGLVLPADDPWWSTHYPPNGWGCKCRVFTMSKRDLARMGKAQPDTAPRGETYEWKDKHTGEVFEVPEGIDPGWAYNVGEADTGRRLTSEVMDTWRAQGGKAWEPMNPGNWESAGRPRVMPGDVPEAALGGVHETPEAAREALEKILGGPEQVLHGPAGTTVTVNAETLSAHLPKERTVYLPFLPELIESPFEVWAAFEQHKGTGRVELRQRFIKIVELKKKNGLLLVAQVRKGVLEAWTFMPVSKINYLNSQRKGTLVYGR